MTETVVIRRNMTGLISKYPAFGIMFLLFLAIMAVLFFSASQNEQFLFVNQFHHPVADRFFMGITQLGDGLAAVVLSLILLFVRVRYCVLTLLALVYTGLVAQIIKRFAHLPRPAAVFESLNDHIYTVQGYPIHHTNSFPSGHTITAFSIAVILSYVIPSKRWGPLFFLTALLIGFSRIYLAQHFVQDVAVGAILGTILTFQLIWMLEQAKWYHSPMMNRRIQFNKRERSAVDG